MTRTRAILFAAMILLLGAAVVPIGGRAAGSSGNASGGAPSAGSSTTGSSTAGGAALVSDRCSKCHPLQRVESAQKDRSGWTRTLTRMQTHGLQVTDAEKQAIIDYLTQRDGGS
jgi:hypothetical protein